ncbi:MAG: putative tellurite resistance protein B-like protein [Arenicella sp.]|jgi:uncharacterized tellurite resistance protein B-like protein
MHMLLSLLGTIVTIVILFKRLSDSGIDLSWLNPFSANQEQPSGKSSDQKDQLFSVSDPLEVAALLAITIAKIDGDLSSHEKTVLLKLFQSEFHCSEQQASDLLLSSNTLFGDGRLAISMPGQIMQSSLQSFSPEKAQSVMHLLNTISQVDSNNHAAKQGFVNQIEAIFDTHFSAIDQS